MTMEALSTNSSTGRFTGRLHLLCEAAKWKELKSTIVRSLQDEVPPTPPTDMLTSSNSSRQSHEDPAENNKSDSPVSADALADKPIEPKELESMLQDRQGPHEWTPLMIACVRAPLDVIALLCHACPKACLLTDKSGSLPLHFVACWRRRPFDEVVVHVMLESCREVARKERDLDLDDDDEEGEFNYYCLTQTNIWGQTPLHMLLESPKGPPSLSVVQALLGLDLEDIPLKQESSRHPGGRDDDEDDVDEESDQWQVQVALATRDNKGHLPLHIGASKGASEEILNLLVDAFPDAAYVGDADGNLPAHLLHNYYYGKEILLRQKQQGKDAEDEDISREIQLVSIGAMESLLAPLAATRPIPFQIQMPRHPQDGIHNHEDQVPRNFEELHRMTQKWSEISATQHHSTDAMIQSQQQPTAAELACQCSGRTSFAKNWLPIHLAAYHGVQIDVLRGLCQNHVPGLKVPAPAIDFSQAAPGSGSEGNVQNAAESAEQSGEEDSTGDNDTAQVPNRQGACALEIFENGRAGQEAIAAANYGKKMTGKFPASEREKVTKVLELFMSRSDLLFAYYPEVVQSSGVCTTGNAHYCCDPKRMNRIEQLIRAEANDPDITALSDTVALAWTWMCQYHNSEMRYDSLVPSIGRVVAGLSPEALWKLTRVKTPLSSETKFVQVVATGRSVAMEGELRTLNTSYNQLLHLCWFQHAMISWLAPMDALNYSVTCRRARATGVRLLPEVALRVTSATWTKPPAVNPSGPSPAPRPWQRLDVLVAADFCHSIYVSFKLDCNHTAEEVEEHGNGRIKEHTRHKRSAGMLVVRDDDRTFRPNAEEPWGDAVVSFCRVEPNKADTYFSLCFRHVPGRTYGMWHYCLSGARLSISDVRVRQVMHSCDMRGQSPLNFMLTRMKNLEPKTRAKLNGRVSQLLQAKFGSNDSIDDVPLHYALECEASEEVLNALISSNPSALIETDPSGKTPLHAALLMHENELPQAGIIRALLTTPGENATKLKDSSGRLPIHIAAERGASDEILTLLVDANTESCYRMDKDGDLPLHLLVKSGKATTSSVETLIRPFMGNETICRLPGSEGVNLPLHIAAEYKCSFEILEKLLNTYGEAASFPRILPDPPKNDDSDEEYAIDIFEKGHAPSHAPTNSQNSTESRMSRTLSKREFIKADRDKRSDLIFVYNPMLVSPSSKVPYRKDVARIRRLENTIRREAEQFGEGRRVNGRATLSDTAKLAWCLMCSFENPDDPEDHYTATVRRILRGLSNVAVNILANVKNPDSRPTPNIPIKDCSIPMCKVLIMSRMRFVGRYVLYDELHPVHKSDSCLVMRARDFGLAQEYERIKAIYDKQDIEVDEDTLDEAAPSLIFDGLTPPNMVSMATFLRFAEKIGVDKSVARKEMRELLALNSREPVAASNDDPGEGDFDDVLGQLMQPERAQDGGDRDHGDDFEEIGKEAFLEFCRSYRIGEDGVRMVVIKFFIHREEFVREKTCRSLLDLSGTEWLVVPIIEDFDVDRIESNWKNDSDNRSVGRSPSRRQTTMRSAPESKDELYALDIQEHSASLHNFARYKHALVMPAGDRDLAEICMHEEPGILLIRQYMTQVAVALRHLHAHNTIHGDIKMSNVVRFGKNLSLIDFDSASMLQGDGSMANEDDELRTTGGTHNVFTGVLPPEMIARFDRLLDQQSLAQYEAHWRQAADDARDLSLLTPDDVQTITSAIDSLQSKSEGAKALSVLASSFRLSIKDHGSSSEDSNRHWKEILSKSLCTISFDDLPSSLNRCRTVGEFTSVWNRLLANSNVWQKVQPRQGEDSRFTYIVKTHNQLPFATATMQNVPQPPYDLVVPSEKIDIWGFGVMLFTLCSGGTLFHLGLQGDLRDGKALAELYDWNKKTAERYIRRRVDDPLAQDLLMSILLPETDRMPNMDTVLQHPFFGPPTSPEAQQILEKYEEHQLLLEETVVVPKMTFETLRKMENSMEKHCKVIFDEERVSVPTCLMVLPYELERHPAHGSLSIVPDAESLSLAVSVGKHLLEINKATARLSFWLMMKKRLASSEHQTFKSELKVWFKRARSEPVKKVVADLMRTIGCGPEYAALCTEILAKPDSVSNAKAYIKEPMGAARKSIFRNINGLLGCFSSQFFYLVDEYYCVPVASQNAVDFGDGEIAMVYPLELDPNEHELEQVCLPFILISVMKATASFGIDGLRRLVGLPKTHGVPESWVESQSGLIHRANKLSSIAEFSVLQDVIRRQGQRDAMRMTEQSNVMSSQSVTTSSRSVKTSSIEDMPSETNGLLNHLGDVGCELQLLEDLLREKDTMRSFADLRRISDGKESSSAIWSTEAVVDRVLGEVELAGMEMRLQELQAKMGQRDQIQQEIDTLIKRARMLKVRSVPRENDAGSTSVQSSQVRQYDNPNSALTTQEPSFSTKSQSPKKRKKNKSKPRLRFLLRL